MGSSQRKGCLDGGGAGGSLVSSHWTLDNQEAGSWHTPVLKDTGRAGMWWEPSEGCLSSCPQARCTLLRVLV